MRKYTKILFIFIVVFFWIRFALAESLELAPDFKLLDTAGNAVTLNSYKNKQPVLLFFWTTWCPFCRRELRVLNQMYAQLTKDGLEVLAINVGERPDRVKSYIENFNLAYRVLLDKDMAIAKSYGIFGVPTYILVDKKGFIVYLENYFPEKNYRALISN